MEASRAAAPHPSGRPPSPSPAARGLTPLSPLPSGCRDCAALDEFPGNETAPNGTNYLEQFRAIEGQVRTLLEVSWIVGTVVQFPLGSQNSQGFQGLGVGGLALGQNSGKTSPIPLG
jgi:hypothetical protein